MHRWILVAAGLSFLTAAVHVFAGGPEVHQALLAAELPKVLKTYISVLWHATTAVLVMNSAALVVAALRGEMRTPLVLIVAGQYAAYAILFLGYGLAYLGSAWEAPQWIAFALIAASALAGLKRRPLKGIVKRAT